MLPVAKMSGVESTGGLRSSVTSSAGRELVVGFAELQVKRRHFLKGFLGQFEVGGDCFWD